MCVCVWVCVCVCVCVGGGCLDRPCSCVSRSVMQNVGKRDVRDCSRQPVSTNESS